MSRAIRPIHTPYDGDILFVLSTGKVELDEPRPFALSMLGTAAADTVARSIGRALWEAETIGGWQSFRDIHGL